MNNLELIIIEINNRNSLVEFIGIDNFLKFKRGLFLFLPNSVIELYNNKEYANCIYDNIKNIIHFYNKNELIYSYLIPSYFKN